MSQILWNSTTTAAIVLAADAGKTETYAAEELAAYFSKMSGSQFIISDRIREGRVNVLVGLGACEAAGFTPDGDLTDDGFMIESLERLAPSSVVLDLDFLVFQPEIAVANCVLTGVLALISLIIPMIKIKAIKPVRIIKARD